MKNKTVLFAVGGSGGHLFPAISIAKSCQKQGLNVVFCGVDLEKNRFFPKDQFKYQSVAGSSIQLKNPIKTLALNIRGFFQSLFFVKKLKPDLTIGFGSFHSFSPVLASVTLRIPFFLFEPNLSLGKVNHLLYSRSKKVLSYFKNSLAKEIWIYPAKTYEKIPQEIVRKAFDIPKDKEVVLIVGGSQGSKILNEAVLQIKPNLLKPFFVVHIAGKNENLDLLKNYYDSKSIQSLILSFTDKMDHFLSIAKCAIARAGASCLIESIEYKIPTLFVPYGEDLKGHQYANANYFAKNLNGGFVINQKELNRENINYLFEKLLDSSATLKENLEKIAHENGRMKVESVILDYLGESACAYTSSV